MTQDTDRIERDVEAAVADDAAGISERVRQITLKVLSQGQLDNAALKEVMSAVVKGAQKGIKRPDEASTAALREAVQGLDQALASAAEAAQLAVREAVGRSSEFSKQSIKKAMDELGSVESMFIDTLGDAARESTGHVRDTLHGLAEHARNSGTAVGARVTSALSQLTHAIANATQQQMHAGADTLRQQAALMAGIAAGMLKGIADRLQPPNGKTPPKSPDTQD